MSCPCYNVKLYFASGIALLLVSSFETVLNGTPAAPTVDSAVHSVLEKAFVALLR